jgi:multicomponent Na+:H+ antiporter subunit G
MDIIGSILITIGTIFYFISSIGILRMPDLLNRLQAGTKASTLGVLSIMIGVGFINPTWFPKLILLSLFILLTNPVGSHYIAKIGYLNKEIKFIDDIDSYENQSHEEENR